MGLAAIIIIAFVSLPLLVGAVFLINGRGTWMIAGYNTMSKAEKEKYNEKALCRFVGWFMIGIMLCVLLTAVGSHFGIRWLSYTWILAIHASIFFAIYANTSKRFLKNPNPDAGAGDAEKPE